MRLIIIRHGDPDYERDSLTERGWREAELLAGRIAKLDVAKFYVSPLGRAKDTASLTLKKMNRTAEECEWLQEFWPRINRPDAAGRRMTLAWDWLPEDWMAEETYFLQDTWADTEIMREGRVGEIYKDVISHFDALLAEHGYVRDGKLYRAERPNRDTIVFFCHFGLECVLLSRLMNVSPMILWHHFCAAPTSVTTVYTEERRAGRAVFRVSAFGDISHLYVAGEEPSFAARFCETFDCEEERHD
ncbi:histidine phosphatase family protein [Acetatifactor muris]|uniref:histidine phosphatase family protein n=1 Tax=Acetatifactor muris TaxID=879566 RepID=UPI0023F4DED7|nr:histidine phosphatase family protein [Acetatifactor muris]